MQYCRRNIVQAAFAIIFPRKSSAAADATILVVLSATLPLPDYERVARDPPRMANSRQLSDPSHSASRPKSQLPRSVVVPTQNSESAQCVPVACPADSGLHLRWNMFGMKEVERPAPVLVAALNHVFDGVTNAALLRALVTAAGLRPARSYSSSPSSTQMVVWNEEGRLLGASQS